MEFAKGCSWEGEEGIDSQLCKYFVTETDQATTTGKKAHGGVLLHSGIEECVSVIGAACWSSQ